MLTKVISVVVMTVVMMRSTEMTTTATNDDDGWLWWRRRRREHSFKETEHTEEHDKLTKKHAATTAATTNTNTNANTPLLPPTTTSKQYNFFCIMIATFGQVRLQQQAGPRSENPMDSFTQKCRLGPGGYVCWFCRVKLFGKKSLENLMTSSEQCELFLFRWGHQYVF